VIARARDQVARGVAHARQSDWRLQRVWVNNPPHRFAKDFDRAGWVVVVDHAQRGARG
jgi:hypothetical protein